MSDWACTKHGLNGPGHVEHGYGFSMFLSCLYEGAETTDGRVFENADADVITRRMKRRLEGYTHEEAMQMEPLRLATKEETA